MRPIPTILKQGIFNRVINRVINQRVYNRGFSTSIPMSKAYVVAQVQDLKDGQMKEVDIPGSEGKVLLSRVKGEFYATGAKCTRTARRGLRLIRLRCVVEKRRFDGKWPTRLSMAWSFNFRIELIQAPVLKSNRAISRKPPHGTPFPPTKHPSTEVTCPSTLTT